MVFTQYCHFKLIERNGGTETKRKNDFLGVSSQSTLDTFHGQMAAREYGLVERDGDPHVHLLSKPEHRSKGEDQDWKLFRALNALPLRPTCPPFSVEHRRDVLHHRPSSSLHEDVADSPHAPFSEPAFNNLTKPLTWSAGLWNTLTHFSVAIRSWRGKWKNSSISSAKPQDEGFQSALPC